MAEFISFEEAKKILGVPDKDLHTFIAQGKLSPVRDGGTIQFPSEEITTIQAERGDGVQLNMDNDEGLVLDFGTDVADMEIEAAPEEITLELPEEDAAEEPQVVLEEEPLVTLEEPEEETISLEEVPEEEETILLDEEDSETIVLLDDDEEDSETIVLSDEGDETIVLADDDTEEGTETISLVDDDVTSGDLTIAMSEDEMVADDDDELAVEMAGGAHVAALPEGAYIVQDMPPSLLVTLPLILGFIILIFGGMILYPMVSNSAPDLEVPMIPSYLTSLVEMVHNW